MEQLQSLLYWISSAFLLPAMVAIVGLFVYATGAWFHLFLPELLGRRYAARAVGHVYYFATPPGDESYRWPNCPSYGVPGCTGWPALPHDSAALYRPPHDCGAGRFPCRPRGPKRRLKRQTRFTPTMVERLRNPD